jgi:hypothetical protein
MPPVMLWPFTIQDVGQPSGQRDRVLSDSELADVWRCTDSDDQQPYYSRLLKMLVLLVTNDGSSLSRWSEWDFTSDLDSTERAQQNPRENREIDT